MKFLALFLFLLSSCCFHSRPISEKSRIATEVRAKVAQKLKKEMGLVPFGCGGGMFNQIEFLGLVFQYYHPLDIEKSRKLLVQATEIFLQEINSNEEIRPYLCNYPFGPENVSITILLRKSDNGEVDTGQLTVVEAEGGNLDYKIYDASQNLQEVHSETYEEALQALEVSQKRPPFRRF